MVRRIFRSGKNDIFIDVSHNDPAVAIEMGWAVNGFPPFNTQLTREEAVELWLALGEELGLKDTVTVVNPHGAASVEVA